MQVAMLVLGWRAVDGLSGRLEHMLEMLRARPARGERKVFAEMPVVPLQKSDVKRVVPEPRGRTMSDVRRAAEEKAERELNG